MWPLYRKFFLKPIAGKITSPLQMSWNELFTVLYYLTRYALLNIKASSHKTESLMTYFLYSFQQPGCPALDDSLKNCFLEFNRGTQNSHMKVNRGTPVNMGNVLPRTLRRDWICEWVKIVLFLPTYILPLTSWSSWASPGSGGSP